MTEKELGIENLTDDTNVVLCEQNAEAIGSPRSTTVGAIRELLKGDGLIQLRLDFK